MEQKQKKKKIISESAGISIDRIPCKKLRNDQCSWNALSKNNHLQKGGRVCNGAGNATE